MKYIFLVCISAYFMFSCNRVNEKKGVKNDLAEYNLKGKVKLLTLFRYNASGDSGNVLKGNLKMTVNWNFDQKGNFIEKRSKYEDDNISHYSIYKYDINEHLIKDSFNIRNNQYCTICLYDDNGYLIEKDFYHYDSGKAKISTTTFYFNNDKGYKVEEDKYSGDKDSFYYKANIKNNERGQELEKMYYQNGKLYSKEVRIYDEKGNEINYRLYKSDSLKSESIYKYDTKGNNIEWLDFKKGKLIKQWIYKYDTNGLFVESEGIESDSSGLKNLSIRTKGFDKEGNWLKSIDTKDGKPTQIVERTIEYYP